MRLLKHIVNSDRRTYFIEKVNAPLCKAITILGGRYPKPTREGVGKVVHPNSLRLIDWWEEFNQVWDLPSGLNKLTDALWRTLITKYEHSPNWRNLLDWVMMKAGATNWKPWNPNRQMSLWIGGNNDNRTR